MEFNLRKVFNAFLPAEAQTAEEGKHSQGYPKESSLSLNLSFMEGQAIVEEVIQPRKAGRVRFQGTWWNALSDRNMTLSPGEIVDVVGLQNITLLVEPALLLKASEDGIAKMNRVCRQKGWELRDSRWLAEASQQLAFDSERSSAAVSAETWERWTQAKPIPRRLFKAYCEVLELDWREIVRKDMQRSETPLSVEQIRASEPELNFVGRREAIANLAALAQAGAKIITIQGKGGLGKTTLARQYFNQSRFERVLECWMAKETQNLTSAESIVQEWLQRDFDEEPGREFGVSLDRLRRQLQRQKVGILIDNLEPVLDQNGKFIEAHRSYVDLLSVLADPTVQSVTLITSREPLHEASINVQPYALPGLEVAAWQQFFNSHQVNADTPLLMEMHRAHGGNAKAMTILSSVIRMDFAGSLEAYWQENRGDLLIETDLEDLVNSHFNRLRQIYPDAYRLLGRLGCYRYQDISTVPLEALFWLLWDVPEEQHRRVVKFLRDLFLVEFSDSEYALHPVIQAKAIAMLKLSGEWEIANRKAAEFWTAQTQTIETTADALRALEAYYHSIQMDDWGAAAEVLLHKRDSQWEKNEPLGVSFNRLGLLQRMVTAITPVIDKIDSGYALSKLHNILGDLYWLTGDIRSAIACHQESRRVAIASNIRDLEIVSLFNIGLCQIELGETEAAVKYFQTVHSLAENTECHKYAVGSWFCLAFLNSCLGQKQEALNFAEKVFNEYSILSSDAWSRGYSLLFLGLTFKNVGELEKAREVYSQAKSYAEESHYTQVEAKALNGLAEIEREQSNFNAAISHHLAAKKRLDQIEAKSDLAEVEYQLGLTHQKMNEFSQSRASFQAAIQLFQQMDAPKQVEKVQRAMESKQGE